MFSDSELIIAAQKLTPRNYKVRCSLTDLFSLLFFFFIFGCVPLHIEREIGRMQEMIRRERTGMGTENIKGRIRTCTAQCANF